MKTIVGGLVAAMTVAAGIVLPAASFAQTATTTAGTTAATTTATSSFQTQLDLIASLTAQIRSLEQQIIALRAQQQATVASLVSTLSLGAQGDQVKVLQALLAADPSIYPQGLVTGYFGRLTEDAVKRYQEKHGIEQAGVVGPKTLQELNADLQDHPIGFEQTSSTASSTSGTPAQLCAIVPPGHLLAPGWLKNGHERPEIPECQTVPPGIEDRLNASSSIEATSTAEVHGNENEGEASTTATTTVSSTVGEGE